MHLSKSVLKISISNQYFSDEWKLKPFHLWPSGIPNSSVLTHGLYFISPKFRSLISQRCHCELNLSHCPQNVHYWHICIVMNTSIVIKFQRNFEHNSWFNSMEIMLLFFPQNLIKTSIKIFKYLMFHPYHHFNSKHFFFYFTHIAPFCQKYLYHICVSLSFICFLLFFAFIFFLWDFYLDIFSSSFSSLNFSLTSLISVPFHVTSYIPYPWYLSHF